MVWGLFPVDPLPDENEYYIFRKGTYKAGRKGCDIIINKDKGVSRVHADIIVNEMICMDHFEKRHSNDSSEVQIRDCSKYGTFIDTNLGSKERVHEYPNKETTLKDGDVVAFGTGNAKYRFSYVPLVLCACSSKHLEMNQLQDKMSLIGASVTQAWTSKCTHMIVDDFIPFNDEILKSIVARKPLARFSWIELIAGRTICTEIPSSLSHAPTLILEGVSLKVADPQSREHCLKGYTFMLESTDKYKFKEKLQLLLNAAGAKVVNLQTSDQCSKNSGDNLVYVLPAGTSNSGSLKKVHTLPKVNEMDLVSAVVCGCLDPSVLAPAPVVITSSGSTDETVVADSDAELETAASGGPSAAIEVIDSAEDESETKMEPPAKDLVHVEEAIEHDSRWKTGATMADREEGIMTKKEKGHLSDRENLDIIYSQSLIVHSPRTGPPLNFKRFTKTRAPSGNSFESLVPFSKYPYKESDNGDEAMEVEKKRKQMEAIAEDLFNNDKGRRRSAGTLPGLFARR